MSKGSEQCFCSTLLDLDLHPPIDPNKLARVDAKYKQKVGHWASSNRLQNYKIYANVIHMFIPNFLDNLQHAPINHPWPK
jgi:hypothetical protein